ncbi:MAG: DUF3822 family protein [Odoribacter sp.]|nr:DUF3822 family protein [Odoribacter sp.]
MQNICYLDTNFSKENSIQYTLSIRYSTDGLSFCLHDNNKLIAFSHHPYCLESQDEVIARVKKTITEDELLKLKYKKVYISPCKKDKILIPAHLFNKNHLADIFRVCLPTEKNDILLYRKIRMMEAYLTEALPRNFVTFLTGRYQSLCIVNNAYPFLVNSLNSALLNTHHLFVDIQDRYFDLLITQSNEVKLFNSFTYNSVPDIIYYILRSLKDCRADQSNLQSVFSGTLVDDPKFFQLISSYIPNISVLTDNSLNLLLNNEELNSSRFIHLLSLHKCE